MREYFKRQNVSTRNNLILVICPCCGECFEHFTDNYSGYDGYICCPSCDDYISF